MKGRKIVADIELRAKDIYVHNQECTFVPCETVSCFYEYPLKIIFPSSVVDGCCQWVYPITFGGGLVEGDNVNITVKIGSQCCVLITTLSFPKVYCCENGLDSEQHVKYNIDPGALLCVLPEPIVCYRKASYVQTQVFHLSSKANLVLLDWYTSGRYIRGERWSFSKLQSISSVYIDGSIAFKESQNLQNTKFLSIEEAMKSYNVVGTCIIIGPYLSSLSQTILLELGKCNGYGQKRRADLSFAVSPLHINENDKCLGCIIRFASESVTEALKTIEELLDPLFHIIGGNPFRNK